MAQPQNTIPLQRGKRPLTSLAIMSVGLIFGMLLCVAISSGIYFIFEAASGSGDAPTIAHAAQIERHVQANLKIVLNQPGMQNDWPAYRPNALVVPAHSLVTITIRNYDLGDTPLLAGSPFSAVQGVVGGVAYVNGRAYTSLAPEKVAHTFTIQQMGINVPVPGDAAAGKTYVEVSFTFRTGEAGLYYFRCFDPCGTGAVGWQGPMVTRGYMLGTLTVQ
ncbi:MAG TPA: hypothetical protein VGT44_05790 [Ktedonobacteraceae bacterium]|nr:hypothetical protein [Ktedonobacteraceae bacterium]